MDPQVQSTDTGETEYQAPGASTPATVSKVEIMPAASGGFAATAYSAGPSGQQSRTAPGASDDYTFTSFDDLVTWLATEFGQAATPAAPSAVQTGPTQ